MPCQYGGEEMDMITYGLLNKELGAACSSTRSLLTVHGMVEQAISRWGNTRTKKFWLPDMVSGKKLGAFGLTEPDYGSNASGISTAAISSGQDYILNGTKIMDFIWASSRCVFYCLQICRGKKQPFSPSQYQRPIDISY